ncbi:DUF2459 domain-containing protein [Croceicoccus sp. F390]|uniref:DUF2459 domain-containing protein n=1 Tax=Croceicoccus esteveae TaxID=3075597 RepID=A0ABU2ZGZ4_9SPHN|nr:DUF2459 domain-containing protein [Croceicoccus sp. F390]MDT0574874.1 DUF2459 domain-containing protein [Croceicoccus sp. F390]
MAAQARRSPVRALTRVTRFLAGGIAVLLGCYFLVGWLASSVPRNGGWQASSAPDAIEIMIGTNGVHTEIILPQRAAGVDWTHVLPPADLAVNRQGLPHRGYTHVGISWGEREIFLDTPTWADLSPFAVLRIVTRGGSALLHVAHYVRPAPSRNYRPLRISRAEYQQLATAIMATLPPRRPDRKRPVYAGYTAQDVFYDARGTYTIFRTCNQWTSERLAGAGIKTGWWTPFAGGVMKWVPEPGSG